jgi:hypothetical protein
VVTLRPLLRRNSKQSCELLRVRRQKTSEQPIPEEIRVVDALFMLFICFAYAGQSCGLPPLKRAPPARWLFRPGRPLNRPACRHGSPRRRSGRATEDETTCLRAPPENGFLVRRRVLDNRNLVTFRFCVGCLYCGSKRHAGEPPSVFTRRFR